jgi:hypothetical protein
MRQLSFQSRLSQIYARKEFVMYDPSQVAYLRSGNKMVDIG